ncbi:MAG: helix-hairpin-helix domain-containing protein, partial [Kiritimatiellia bacterium]|nr:helix-hairpin-helix domain-containing protein [Kiritimatiellia bacterium]
DLPGVGNLRARLILKYREEKGAFSGIYDLLRVPGIGRKLFRQITGLRPVRKNRKDRHEKLNQLLNLPAEERPSLGRIMQKAAETLQASGSALAGLDGVLLAQTGFDPASADRYAAFTPNFFRKTRRYWPLLGEDRIQQVALPGARPPTLLTHGPYFSWILLLAPDADWREQSRCAAAIAEELDWLFSPHAVVRQVETPANFRYNPQA